MSSSNTAKDYNGFVFDTKKSVVITAKSVESAKAVMTDEFGPEFTGRKKNWVCGLAPHAFTGHKLTSK